MATAHETVGSPPWHLFRIVAFCCTVSVVSWNAAGCDTGMNSQDVNLGAAFDRTGTLRSDGEWLPMSPSVIIIAGDTGNISGDSSANNLERRAFVSVTHTAIPKGAKVDKESEEGTTFIISLPLALQHTGNGGPSGSDSGG